MKKLLTLGTPILVLALLLFSGNRITELVLDARLAGILSRELGIPVTLGPTRVNLIALNVSTPKLIMGEPADPAIFASDVSVSLDWADLGLLQLRLRRASAASLAVKPSQWPGNDAPWPTDYRFIDPYLPDLLLLDSGSYIGADGSSHPLSDARWQRQDGGANVNWQETWRDRPVAISLQLQSLDALLRLARLQLKAETEVAADTASRVSTELDLQPGASSGYRLSGSVSAGEMMAQIKAGNTASWQLPDESSVHIERLDIANLQNLLQHYDGPANQSAEELPRLALPGHQGQLNIDEIHWHGQVRAKNTLAYSTGPDSITLSNISSLGAGGTLSGSASLASSADGWRLDLIAQIEAIATDQSLATPYLAADWSWHSGRARVTGTGGNTTELLNSLQGELELAGSHKAEADTPVTIAARLDNSPDKLSVETIDIRVAEGRVSGSATLSSGAQRQLRARLKAEQLNLNLLLPPPDKSAPPGLPLPAFIEALPQLDLDWQLDTTDLQVTLLRIKQGRFTLRRTEQGGFLTADLRDPEGGTASLRLDAARSPGKQGDYQLSATMQRVNLPRLFQQQSTFAHSRTSGTIAFSGNGDDPAKVLASMQGSASLSVDLRRDNDWQRAALPGEELSISGKAKLVTAGQRITGVEINGLDIGSSELGITGSLSMVDGRDEWLIASLRSDKLDIDALRELAASGTASDDESTDLSALQNMSASRYSLRAASVLVGGLELKELDLRVATRPGGIDISQLNFVMQGGTFTSEGSVNWHQGAAALSVDARVTNFPLDDFLIKPPSGITVPVSGTMTVQSKGGTLDAMLGNLSGHIELLASQDSTSSGPQARRKLSMTAHRVPQGMEATIRSLQWGETDLSGNVTYHDTTPPLVEVELDGGKLSLLSWEEADKTQQNDNDKQENESFIGRTAKTSMNLIGDVVLAPLRLVSGPEEASPGDKLFSSEPLPLEWIKDYRVKIHGKLDAIESLQGRGKDLELDVAVIDGALTAHATAASINTGSAWIKLSIDAMQQPPAVHLNGQFKDLKGPLGGAAFSRSGYFDVRSRGRSQAELAAAVDGFVYLELGAGKLDYTKLMLLTADVATSAFETLIPGAGKKPPELECAVTLGVFKDGMGVTPYGYAARTNLANLVGRMELDLKKELLRMNFSSSSRKGMGLSVGNVFSNTIEIEGALSDPKIIPDATGLLWRSWAAVMTGGLSVIGESMFKRVLASENPCDTVKKHVKKEFCPINAAAAATGMICPGNQAN